MLDLDSVREEVNQKRALDNIHRATAWKWASRAAATYEAVLTEDPKNFSKRMIIGAEFNGEALEHAAQTQWPHILVKEIYEAIDPYLQAAWKHIDNNGEKNV